MVSIEIISVGIPYTRPKLFLDSTKALCSKLFRSDIPRLNSKPCFPGITDDIPLLIPKSPSPHEEELYKSLLADSVPLGGVGVNLRKMLGLWDKAIAKNSTLPGGQRKSLRRATLVSLDLLRERINVRDNIRWSAQPIRELDAGLREVRSLFSQ
jgi:hypothetical protein